MRTFLVALAFSISGPALAQATQEEGHVHGEPPDWKGTAAGAVGEAKAHAGQDAPETPAARRSGSTGHSSGAGHGRENSKAAEPAQEPGPTPSPPSPSRHAGHQSVEDSSSPPVAGPPPAALTGPEHAADFRFDPRAMRIARLRMYEGHGAIRTHKIMIDQLEWKGGDDPDAYAWEGQAWFGGDIDKLWFKTRGEGDFDGRLERAEFQALWSHAFDPWFDLQLGVRHDFRSGPDRTYAAIGVHGLAPFWIELDAAAFVSNKGQLLARIEAQHDVRLTRKLILQPLAQFDLAANDDHEQRIGAGLSSLELALRLRYEIEPEFAPYLGVAYERAFGRTAAFRRAGAQDAEGVRALAGVTFWF